MELRYGQIARNLKDGTTLVKGNCVFTRQDHEVIVPTDGLDRWLGGELIQSAMPQVSKEDREFLISGISPQGWNEIFKEK